MEILKKNRWAGRGVSCFFGNALVSLLPLLISSAASGQPKAIVKIDGEKVVASEKFSLGEIASVSAQSPLEAERIKAIPMGISPAIGIKRELGREKVKLSIQAAGLSESAFQLDMPKVVLISRSSDLLGPEIIRAAAEKALREKYGGAGISLEILRLGLPGILAIPKGKLEVKAYPPVLRDLSAPFNLPIEIKVDERVFRRISAAAQIEPRAEVLAALKDIPSGASLSPEDFELKTTILSRPLNAYFGDQMRLAGMIALRAIPKGGPIMADSIASGQVVKAGDRVSIIGISGGLEIRIAGEARASGKIGAKIAVKNLQSGATLQATIIKEGLVGINF